MTEKSYINELERRALSMSGDQEVRAIISVMADYARSLEQKAAHKEQDRAGRVDKLRRAIEETIEEARHTVVDKDLWNLITFRVQILAEYANKLASEVQERINEADDLAKEVEEAVRETESWKYRWALSVLSCAKEAEAHGALVATVDTDQRWTDALAEAVATFRISQESAEWIADQVIGESARKARYEYQSDRIGDPLDAEVIKGQIEPSLLKKMQQAAERFSELPQWQQDALRQQFGAVELPDKDLIERIGRAVIKGAPKGATGVYISQNVRYGYRTNQEKYPDNFFPFKPRKEQG